MKRGFAVSCCIFGACISQQRGERAGETALALVVDGGQPPCPSDAGSCVEVAAPLDPADGCTDERWVAVVSADDPPVSCPPAAASAHGAWHRSRLFADKPGRPAPRGLAGYCLYSWAPALKQAPDLTALAHIDGATLRRSRDCSVVSGAGSSRAVDLGWQTMRADFHAQAGRVSAGGAPLPTRVAVIDSAPDGLEPIATEGDRSGHGQAVAEIIRELACIGGGGCPHRIATHLALPRVDRDSVDELEGGYFGFQSEAAVAIFEAVRSWQEANDPVLIQPRLIVNLSLGWEPIYGGDYVVPASLPAAVQAVHATIVHGACWGAAFIASAGNRPHGPAPAQGPLFPAGWETQPGPTPAQCAAFEGAGYAAGWPPGLPLLPPPGTYHPLVHAVGGARADDTRLHNARSGGRPRLVAPGNHAVAEGTGATPTAMLTGTSAAAAVASGVAASVWALRPELSAAELMALLHASAVDLGPPADFCLGGYPGNPCPLPPASPARQVSRVSQCGALLAACGSGAPRCPAQLSCTVREAGSGVPPFLPGEVFGELVDGGVVVPMPALTYELPPVPICGHSRLLTTAVASYPSSVCPVKQRRDTPAVPWIGPQPGSNACPLCMVKLVENDLYHVALDLGRDFEGVFFGIPVVTINEEIDVALEGVALEPGQTIVLEYVDLGVPHEDVKTMSVAFDLWGEDGERYSSDSDLVIQP